MERGSLAMDTYVWSLTRFRWVKSRESITALTARIWWWNSRGYTSWSGGLELYPRLDYLQSRPEVDGERIGVTGRSGGGAYSWWISALDDRIKAAVPVAGIADLRNHVVDGCVEGHCDCMFMVNTYRWDYAQIAALIAPRPLLISNTDKDPIFPLDGVVRVHRSVSRIYDLYEAEDKLGLVITEGPHKDSQQLRVPAFHWFNRWLKGAQPDIAMTAEAFFKPQELKVFDALPSDEITSVVYETFTPKLHPPRLPAILSNGLPCVTESYPHLHTSPSPVGREQMNLPRWNPRLASIKTGSLFLHSTSRARIMSPFVCT